MDYKRIEIDLGVCDTIKGKNIFFQLLRDPNMQVAAGDVVIETDYSIHLQTIFLSRFNIGLCVKLEKVGLFESIERPINKIPVHIRFENVIFDYVLLVYKINPIDFVDFSKSVFSKSLKDQIFNVRAELLKFRSVEEWKREWDKLREEGKFRLAFHEMYIKRPFNIFSDGCFVYVSDVHGKTILDAQEDGVHLVKSYFHY